MRVAKQSKNKHHEDLLLLLLATLDHWRWVLPFARDDVAASVPSSHCCFLCRSWHGFQHSAAPLAVPVTAAAIKVRSTAINATLRIVEIACIHAILLAFVFYYLATVVAGSLEYLPVA